MGLRITPEWLRKKTNTEPDSEVEAGIPTGLLTSISMFLPADVVERKPEEDQRSVELKHAFGVFVRGMRLRDKLSVEELADAASVMAEDIHSIETNTDYTASPRTIVHLAKEFKINTAKMMIIAGVAQTIDEEVAEETLKFAAKSDGVSTLNRNEQKLLNAFVKFLGKA